MSKKCIVQWNGKIGNICEAGDEFPIYEGADKQMVWMDMPDDFIYNHDTSRVVNGEFVNVKFHEPPTTLLTARKVGYGDIGEQLDMQYRDKVNGTTEWEDHVTAVKTSVKKPSLAESTDEADAAEYGDQDRAEPQWEKV